MSIERNSKNGYKFYDKDNNKLNILSCVNCEICDEWKTQPWKSMEFCPVHCHFCYYAGYDDEFTIFPDPYNLTFGYFSCLKCDKILHERMHIKNIIKRSIHGK